MSVEAQLSKLEFSRLKELTLGESNQANIELLEAIEKESISRERLLLRNGWDLATLAYGGLAVVCRERIDDIEGALDGTK